jgi:TldD protein
VTGSGRRVDEDFRALPADLLADAALQRAQDLGAGHADLRLQRMRRASAALRDGRVASTSDDVDTGLAVRVLVDGVWGFAASSDLSVTSAAAVAARAVEMARVSRPLAVERVELADEPVYSWLEWVSSYTDDPFDVPEADRVALLGAWSADLLGAPGVDHAEASVDLVKEQKYYADLQGTVTLQQRVRVHPGLEVVAVTDDGAETMHSLAPPTARGWEYLRGEGWNWDVERAELPRHLAERVAAPSVQGGVYDLVIAPSNLWLTLHESVGHATELDRAIGYEAAYAGTSFATPDRLGSLRYGSDLMTVTGDRTDPHGCATVGFDDEGVQAQSWDLVRDGVLVGYQLDRQMARLGGRDRSNGCAYADSAAYVPVQRMANVSLQPAADGPSTDALVAGVEDGLYVVGDKSWSIDMQRYNFQFTAQRFYRIRGGRLAGQVKDAAYQGSTPRFWGSLTAVGGPGTYELHGAPNCGKAQPGQAAWVGHGCPATVFSGVTVLNTREEGGR